MNQFDFYGFMIMFGIAAIVAHEWGHLKYMRKQGRNPKLRLYKWCIQVGTPKDYNKFSNKQLRNVYLAGIIAGLIPIMIGSFLFSTWYLLLCPLYVLWCWRDINNAWRYR